MIQRGVITKTLTIIEDDDAVIIDGFEIRPIAMPELAEQIWAIQWDQVKGEGHIEYNDKINNPNKKITSIDAYQPIVDRFWDEYTRLVPTPDLALRQWEARRRVNDYRAILEYAPVEYNGATFAIDRNLERCMARAVAGAVFPDGFTFRSVDNVDVPMTATDFTNLELALLARTNEIYMESWAEKARIDAMTDMAEVETSVWAYYEANVPA